MRSQKNKTIYTLLIVVCVLGFWLFENFYTPASYSKNGDSALEGDFPEVLLPTSTTGQVVKHSYYCLSYSEPYEQAEWVAYALSKSQLTYEDRRRPYFIEDPWVTTKSADWRNYRGSGYDRGHLCPAGDRRFSVQAYNETFYTSNITPQDKEFNAGLWNRLEMQVRAWAKRYGIVYVYTGGILTSGLEEIGEEDVDVPKYFYKIVARGTPEDLKVIAFIVPNYESNLPLENFLVSVDAIEERTGIDFFHHLSKSQEELIESKVRTNLYWK